MIINLKAKNVVKILFEYNHILMSCHLVWPYSINNMRRIKIRQQSLKCNKRGGITSLKTNALPDWAKGLIELKG